jgi:putative SOS response-associated peptidase YedK
VDTFTIITTAPNDVVGQYHERMPLIVEQRDYETWLDPASDHVAELMRPYQASDLECWRVGDEAKRSANRDGSLNDAASLLDPADH